MNFITRDNKDHSTYLQLFMLVIFAVFGLVAGIVLGFLICFAMYGTEIFSTTNGILSGNPKFLTGLKAFQTVSAVFLFIVPAIFLSLFNKKRLTGLYGFKKPKAVLLLVVLLIMCCSTPIMEWITLMNQKMTFPGFLKGIEEWMREKEDAATQMTIALLTVRNSGDFIVNLVMIALVPAVGEELFFRGGLQQIFIKIFSNHHVAIWVTAIIFSAIHFQFFGFFPRLLLGAAFGYLYYWSGSLWYTMLAHFLNNGYAVCGAFYMQKHHMPLDSTEPTMDIKWYGYVISFVLTTALFLYFKNKTKQINGEQLD